MDRTELVLHVTKALNGWTVRCGESLVVVPDTDDLGQSVVALIAAERLNPTAPRAIPSVPYTNSSLEQLAQLKSVNSAWGVGVGMVNQGLTHSRNDTLANKLKALVTGVKP